MDSLAASQTRIASTTRRLWATLIDDVVFVMAIVVVALVLAERWDVTVSAHLTAGRAVAALVLMCATALIPALTAGLTGGRTIGKLICGIRAVRTDGQPYDFGFAFRRDLVSKYITWGYHAKGMKDWNLMVSDPEHRSGHDRDCGTIVVCG
ncbi:MAG: RDD family protein [Solirubrobacterales bacterium]